MDRFREELRKTYINSKLLDNSLQPFYRLHPDIITEISRYLDPRACDYSYEPLLCATQICRSWRDTLVSQPSQWSLVNGVHPDLIPCLLDRSKGIRLDAIITPDRISDVIEYINPHVDRLSSLQFAFHRVDDSTHTALRNLNPPPNLCCLTIVSVRHFSREPPGYTPGIVNPIPSLHNLWLFGFPVTPELTRLENLTVVGLDASCTPLRTIFDLLSRNPLLKAVHIWGRHTPDGDDGHPPGSVTLNHLEVLWSEVTPLVHLEALALPRGARILSGFEPPSIYGYPSAEGVHTASFPIPASFSNLRDMRKLRLVDQGDVYAKLEGESGGITYRMTRDRPFGTGELSGMRLEDVTDATYELSPSPRHGPSTRPTTPQRMISRVVCGMHRLQKLELSCSANEIEHFLLVLHSPNVCNDLKILVLSHCVELYRQMRGLASVAESRKAAGMGLDIVRIILPNVGQLRATFRREYVARLGRAVGTLEYVEAELGWSERSSLRFDPEAGINQSYIS